MVVKILNPQDHFSGNDSARKRIAQTQDSILSGTDPWTRRFEELDWTKERYSWEKEDGELVRLFRSGTLEDPEDLRDFFKDTMIDVEYTEEEEFAELAIYPLGAVGTNKQQHKHLMEMQESWIESYTDAIEAAIELYAYLEDYPDRAEACFGEFYDDLIDPERQELIDATEEEEEELLQRFNEALDGVLEILSFESGSAYSPNELSRLEYDAFPAPLTIQFPGKILEVEGFEVENRHQVVYTGTSLWEAFRNLDGKWYSPDPVLPAMPWFFEKKGDEDFFDIDAFLDQPRWRTTVPSEQEVRHEVESALTPVEVYRVRWGVYGYARNEPEDNGS